MIDVQMQRVKMASCEIGSHGLPDRRIEFERQPGVAGINGVGVGPVQLQVIPEVDRLLAILEDVFIDLKGKGMASESDLRVHVKTGELAFIVMRETGGEDFNVQVDI